MPPVNRPRPGQKPQAQTAKKSSNSNSTIIGIIIVIAVLALIPIGYFFLYPLIQENSTPVTTVEITSSVDTTTIAPPVVEDIVVKQESSSSVPKGYYIIVGSFQNKDNADRMVKNIKKDIQLEVLYFEDLGVYRVSAGHYDNIHKAYNDTYSVKDLDGCANAWVLENQ